MLSAQTPQELFNQALVQERAAGNLEQAIQLYQRVAKESSSNDRSLAVQALMGAARSFQKLGQTAQSRNMYQQVARLYPEQREQAAIARESLADTGIVQGTVLRSGSAEPVANAKVSLSGGPVDPTAFAQLQAFFKARNVEISAPSNGLVDQKYLQYLADTASARGVSMANPAVQAAMARFQSLNDARFTASSDILGHFTISNVPPGRYKVRSEREGYFPPPADADLSEANEATVAAGRTAIVEVSMVRGATVSGKITDASGQPQPNATVQAYSVQYQNGFPILQPAVAKTTNDQGEYRLFWLVSGEYLIAVTPGLAPGEGGAVSSTAAQPRPDGGLPAPRTFYPGTPDIAQATPVFIRGDSPVSGIDILARNVPTFRVRGEIHSFVPIPSSPVGGFPQLTAFFAIRPRDTNTPDDFGTPTMSAMLHQDGNTSVGEFNINGVAPGSYDVRAWVPEENPDGGARLTFAHAEVEVFSQDATGISLDIYPSVRVNGSVTVDGVVPSPALRVWLQVDGALAKAGVYQGLAARASLVNNQTGDFMIPAVPSGHFRALMGSGVPSN